MGISSEDYSKLKYYIEVPMHGGWLILLWIDNIFNNIEFFLMHLIFLVIFCLFYLIINLIVTLTYEPVLIYFFIFL